MALTTTLKRFIADERGATAVEYGLLTALISVAIMGSLGTVGAGIKNTFSTVSADLTASH